MLAVRRDAVEAAYLVKRTRIQLSQATRLLVAAEASRSAQLERYRAGVASLLELLDAEGLEHTARRQRIEAERAHHLGRIQLLTEVAALDLLAR